MSAPGLRTTLPANLDRPGPRWWIRLINAKAPSTKISFDVGDAPLSPATAGVTIGSIVATPIAAAERVVPIDQACGRYVDWYRAAGT